MSVIPDPTTTKWVPLQGNLTERMAYWGAYNGSKVYNDGDCAVGADGILYMCVQNGTVGKAPIKWPGVGVPQGPVGPAGPQGVGIPSPVVNGQWVKGVGGVAVWSPITVDDVIGAAPKPTYATTLPASPVDGQEVILVDSLTAPTRTWRCRYNAQQTATAYKWEVLGGTPILGWSQGQVTVGQANAWINVVATAITIPIEGSYLFSASYRVNNGYGGTQHCYMMLWANSQGNVFGPQGLVGLNSGWWAVLSVSQFSASFAAGTTIGVAAHLNTGTPGYVGEVAWSAMPIRLWK